MRIVFIHQPDGPDQVQITRDDGSEARWAAAGGPGLPHDLVHYVVETELNLKLGLWGLVRAGVELDAVNAGAHDGAELENRDLTQLLQGEAVAGGVTMALLAPELHDMECLAHIWEQCRRSNVAPPEGLFARVFGRLRERAGERRDEWAALAPDGTLVVEFPAAVQLSG
ncbi:MAG: hypothetical protein M3M99_06390 [Actinomycetota bacterium]|nr:hypothetical protein [Actinomycetota bacterium]